MDITYIDRKTGLTCLEKSMGIKRFPFFMGMVFLGAFFLFCFAPHCSCPVRFDLLWLFTKTEVESEEDRSIYPSVWD